MVMFSMKILDQIILPAHNTRVAIVYPTRVTFTRFMSNAALDMSNWSKKDSVVCISSSDALKSIVTSFAQKCANFKWTSTFDSALYNYRPTPTGQLNGSFAEILSGILALEKSSGKDIFNSTFMWGFLLRGIVVPEAFPELLTLSRRLSGANCIMLGFPVGTTIDPRRFDAVIEIEDLPTGNIKIRAIKNRFSPPINWVEMVATDDIYASSDADLVLPIKELDLSQIDAELYTMTSSYESSIEFGEQIKALCERRKELTGRPRPKFML